MARDVEYTLELLVEFGLVTQEQIDAARSEIEAVRSDLDVVDMLIKLGYLNAADLTSMLAQQYGMEIVDLAGYDVPPEIIQALTPEIVRHFQVVPVMRHDDVLTVAMSDPTDLETLDSLRYYLGRDVDAVIADAGQIEKLINR